jgi:hypothetical protein
MADPDFFKKITNTASLECLKLYSKQFSKGKSFTPDYTLLG